MKKFIILPFKISLFEGEGSAAPSGAENGQQTGGELNQSGENVVYGKQPNNQEGQVSDAATQEEVGREASTSEELRQKYDEFMKDEQMKAFFNADTQNIINRRFKEQKSLERQLGSQQEVIDKLYQKYNVSDVAELSEAIDNDTAFWEDAAMEAGMSVEQYKSFQEMKRKSDAAERFFQNQQKIQQARAQYARWVDEAQAVKAKYPEFDLDSELQNPNFRGLLGQQNPMYNMDMTKIYEICHMDEITNGIRVNTQKTVEKQITDNVRARGQRPFEGALQQGAGVVIKDDVSKLTKKDREEIAKRVLRGEKISF